MIRTTGPGKERGGAKSDNNPPNHTGVTEVESDERYATIG